MIRMIKEAFGHINDAIVLALIIMLPLGWLMLWFGIGYAILHFITKWW